MISIVIITKEEEKYLPKLLESIRKQDFKDYEIIVSDAHSTDKTRHIAKNYGCRVVDGGLPSVGRNKGARFAEGDILMFLDADIELPKNFLDKNIDEIKRRQIDIASTYIIPVSRNLLDKLFYSIFNNFVKLTQFSYPHASGNCIICTRKIFDKVNGFDENIKMAEDMDFVRRCLKEGGKFRILRSSPIYSDVRRFEKDGRISIAVKYTFGEIYRIFIGEMKNSPFKYELHGEVPAHKVRKTD